MSTSDNAPPSRPVRAALMLVALTLVAVLASCAGADDEAASTAASLADAASDVSSDAEEDPAGTGATDGGAVTGGVPDACSLLGAADAEAIVGEAVEPSALNTVAEEGTYSGCMWTTDLSIVLGVQVATPQDGIDPLVIITGVADASEPSPVGRDGAYFPGYGFIPGGGGVGQSVFFYDGPWSVLVGVTGTADGVVDRAAMEELAAKVEAALG